MCEELRKQFHTESDIWLLRQQLLNRKQPPHETVVQYTSEIRKFCQCFNLPSEENVNYLFNGLKPELKKYVILQRAKTFSEAEMHAKLKEALPEAKEYNIPFNNNHNPRADNKYNQPLGRDEITHINRQELRRSRNQQN